MYSWKSLLYRLLVTGGGLGWLLWSLLQPHDPLDWEVVGIFVLLSWLVKRAGFRVTSEVTHSLVNVVDVGALLVLGPLSGAIVGAVSSIFHVIVSNLRRSRRQLRDLLDLPLFDGGVKSLLALAGGSYYLMMGGTLAPVSLDVSLLLPLGVLYLFWFSLDHLLWFWLFLVSGGRDKAREFWQRIMTTSLLIELAPLPFSILFAVAWVVFSPMLRLLLLVGLVLVAVLVRGFALSLRQAEERVEAVSLLNKFGQALVLAQLDENKLITLLYEYAERLLPHTRSELVLLDTDAQVPRPILARGMSDSRVVPFLPSIIPLLQERTGGRLLRELSLQALQEEATSSRGERPERGSVLLIPLVSSDELMGIFAVQSNVPDTLTLDDGRTLSVLATQAAVALQNARHFKQEQWRVRQMQTIAEVSRMVASVIKLDDLLWQATDLIKATFNYYHVQIYLVEPETNEVVYRAGSGEAGKKLAKLPMRLRIGTDGIIGWVVGNEKPLLVPDVSKDRRYIPDLFSVLPDTRTELAIPLKIEDRVLGVLDVQHDTVNGLDEDDLFALSTLADQLAIAIEDAGLYVAQRETAWVTTSLLEVAEAINPLFDVSELLQTLARIIPPLARADMVAVYLWRSEECFYTSATSEGLGKELLGALDEACVVPSQFPLLDRIREQNEMVVIDQVERSRLVPGALARASGDMGMMALPLQAQGEFVGVMLLGFRGGVGQLSDRRRALVLGMAQQAAISLQGATLYAAQREEAMITRDLLEMAERIASHSEMGEVLELVTRLTVNMAGVQHCVVYLWEEENGILRPAEAHGFSPEIETAWLDTTLDASQMDAFDRLYHSQEPVQLGTGMERANSCAPLYTLFEERSVVAMSLRARQDFLGIMLVDVSTMPARIPERLRSVLTGIARQLSVALENSALVRDALENERRTQELVLARQIQTALLPDRAPDVPGYDIAGYWRPAREVAGDFYDFLRISGNRLAFSIADVADKGIGAALFMVLARGALRESLWNAEDAGRAMARTNSIIAADVRNGMFLTTFLAILTPESGAIQAANAGHLPPLLFRAADRSLSSTLRRNLPMGILEDVPYETIDFVLDPGDTMVLVTDGLMEAMNPELEPYGLQRLSELVYEHHADGAHAMVTTILDSVLEHARGEPFFDDLTLIVLRRIP